MGEIPYSTLLLAQVVVLVPMAGELPSAEETAPMAVLVGGQQIVPGLLAPELQAKGMMAVEQTHTHKGVVAEV